MKNNTKQVVILDNFTSPYIHQAIFILKDYNPALEGKIIVEAERIVYDYLNPKSDNSKPKRKKFLPILLSSFLAMLIAIFTFKKLV